MGNEIAPKSTTEAPNCTDELTKVLKRLTIDQVRFVVARQEHGSDKDAAEAIDLSPETVKNWKYKGAPIDDAVRLMALDGVIVAKEMRRRNLAKAMLVKVGGLDSDDEGARQRVATEIIEWEMGKATQPQDITSGGEAIRVIVGGIDLDNGV